LIEVEGLTRRYDGRLAVDGVSFRVEAGELLALVGGSGSGKTTTLKMINRLVEPDAGRVVLDGRDAASLEPHALRRSIGYVFQGVGLFPHMSVAENVGVPLRLARWPRDRIDARVAEMLRLVELEEELGGRAPATLSGGQQQRVAWPAPRRLAPRPAPRRPFAPSTPHPRPPWGSFSAAPAAQATRRLRHHDVAEALVLAGRIGVMPPAASSRSGRPGARAQPPTEVARLLDCRHAPGPPRGGAARGRP
jgi:osmoprotectant transport system ATP-binding protein